MEPELATWKYITKADPTRPLELVTVVLGACVVGLIKCVDLAWLEMHNNELIQDVCAASAPSFCMLTRFALG